ncbi:MAG: hypothetical protein JXA50_08570 [Deltaproteobacteria bacterium]|nr:hypothetical protein [Deltaproteobacteria bacterium]
MRSVPKAHIISVDMGYGHQRAAYALKGLVPDRIITANNDSIVPESDTFLWERARMFYETVSRLKEVPLVGNLVFDLYNRLQHIAPIFPFRDLSRPTYSVRQIRRLIKKKGFGRSLVDYVGDSPLPVITTHFIPALVFHYHGREAYCVVTDTDIHRVWASRYPPKGYITYLSPCRHASLRLREYGVPQHRIIETGFPLPKENIGERRSILHHDLIARLVNLDPNGVFFENLRAVICEKLFVDDPAPPTSFKDFKRHANHPLTITYAIGGAGAQADIALDMIKAYERRLREDRIKINIAAGTKPEVKELLERGIERIGLDNHVGRSITIVYADIYEEYYTAMNRTLRTTDILWSKPSEMSFYTALGLPVVIAPHIGAHEQCNCDWLTHLGSGYGQEDADNADEWLTYWLEGGQLARAALQGYLYAPCMGTYNIEKVIQERHAITAAGMVV